MSEIVRAVHKGRQSNMSRFFAERLDAKVVDEPTHNADGSPRGITTAAGRPVKKKTTVDEASAAKKAVTEPALKKENDQ